MDQEAANQLATLDFAVRALRAQVLALQDAQMDVVSNCEPWTVRRLASHAFNNQLLWAGIVTGVETERRWARIVTGEHTASPEETMGAVPYDGDLAPFADEATDRSLAMWGTD